MMWKVKCLDMFKAPLPHLQEREKEVGVKDRIKSIENCYD
jgi:hypothetical protein